MQHRTVNTLVKSHQVIDIQPTAVEGIIGT